MARVSPCRDRPVPVRPGRARPWIVDAVRKGKRIGVTAQSHKASATCLLPSSIAPARRVNGFASLQKASDDQWCVSQGSTAPTTTRRSTPPSSTANVDVVAGTAWLFARPALDDKLDCW